MLRDIFSSCRLEGDLRHLHREDRVTVPARVHLKPIGPFSFLFLNNFLKKFKIFFDSGLSKETNSQNIEVGHGRTWRL